MQFYSAWLIEYFECFNTSIARSAEIKADFLFWLILRASAFSEIVIDFYDWYQFTTFIAYFYVNDFYVNDFSS